MAVSFPGSSSNQILVNSAGVPTGALYSVVCWMYFTSGTNANYAWSLDSATAGQYALCGAVFGNMVFDWPGAGNTYGDSVSTGTWYRVGVVVNGTTATLYQGTANSALSTYTQSANYAQPTGTLSWKIGGSTALANNGNCRVAAFKVWDAALSAAEVDAATWSYMPMRTANISRWHPFVNAETMDYSGLGHTLTGGTGITTANGPPIPWRSMRDPFFAPDPTLLPWYVVYVTSTGELFSIGDIYQLQADQSIKTYYGPPVDLQAYEWSPTALDFVTRAGYDRIDRVADLLADGALTSAWAALSAPQSTAMQDRIGQMLGPYRYRLSGEAVDL